MIQRLERTDVVEILERIFDKGIVVDAWARIALAGIHLATIEARIVMASLETHLAYATSLNDVVAPSRSALDGSQSLSARERASLRIVHKAFDAWNFRDVDGYTALLDNGYIGETHRNPTPLRGPEDARRAMKAYFDAFPGLHFTIEGALAAGDDVLVSWLTTPPQPRADHGADPAAPPSQVPGCTVTRLRGRRIVHTWSYWDTPHWLQPTATARD
jgi:ketosteroid isomerase-like protein